MKKFAAIFFLFIAFLLPTAGIFAQQIVIPNTTPQSSPIPVRVVAPRQGIDPATTVGQLVTNALTLVFIVAALAVLVFLVWGAFEWITSGGDKEAVGKARGKIVNALIGLAILALAFLITRVVGQIVNIDILNLKNIPTLSQCGPNQRYNPENNTCELICPVGQRPTAAGTCI